MNNGNISELFKRNRFTTKLENKNLNMQLRIKIKHCCNIGNIKYSKIKDIIFDCFKIKQTAISQRFFFGKLKDG